MYRKLHNAINQELNTKYGHGIYLTAVIVMVLKVPGGSTLKYKYIHMPLSNSILKHVRTYSSPAPVYIDTLPNTTSHVGSFIKTLE